MAGIGCGGGQGPTVYRFTVIQPGAQCPYGGLEVQSGSDNDGNGRLEDSEIDSTQTVVACNKVPQALLKITPLNPGDSHCPGGGTEIQSGIDANSDGQLEQGEIQSTAYVCDGTNGTNGTNGHNSLVRLSSLPNGAQGCQFGGTLVSSGLDLNDDGRLEDNEVQTSSAVCSVQVIANVIVTSSVMPPNAAGSTTATPNASGCKWGGVQQQVGVDLNHDGALEPSEVTGTTQVCNQVMLIAGHNSLISTSSASAAQCAWGGNVIQTGIDTDDNNILEPSEVQSIAVVCNGANGYSSLVTSTPDTTNCGSRGGVDIKSGLDTDRNGVLDPSEVTNTAVVCNGYTGADGHTSLIRQSADTTVCGPNGGVRIDSGVDSDNNGILDPSEVAYTSYVCNGQNGHDTLMRATAEPVGANCSNGGVRYDSGPDLNNNGLLDPSEIRYTNYVCNGSPGWIVDVSHPAEYSVCPHGGTKILVGPDTNSDGLLEGAEIMQTSYVCNP